MAIADFKIPNTPQWVFRSETAGDWDVYFYSVNAAVQVEKYSSGEIADSIEAVRALISVMCKTHNDNQEDDDSTSTEPTEEDLAAFTDEDINSFSREFLEHDNSLGTTDKLEKSEDQSDAEFFLQVLEGENKKQSEKRRDMLSKLNSSLGGLLGSKNSGIRRVSEDLLKQNRGLESYYSPKLKILEPSPKLFVPPPNPIHETNDRLGDMTERLENLVGFGENALQIMTGLQVASVEFLEKFSTEAENNSRAANKAIWVGIFAVLFSVGQIFYTEFRRVPQDTAAMDAALASVRGEIDELQTALGADLTSYQAAQAETAAAVADSVNSTGETNTALLQRIDQLLQQQKLQNEAIIEALGAILETARNPAE
ncbi:MAG: hypothetical protein ABF285_04745 [Pacificibacter sp.]|uniref:hypothetical protein n=1 Tax=Pacificibacter sp. TaxID=1917866 RepID=UPI00321947C5